MVNYDYYTNYLLFYSYTVVQYGKRISDESNGSYLFCKFNPNGYIHGNIFTYRPVRYNIYFVLGIDLKNEIEKELK